MWKWNIYCRSVGKIPGREIWSFLSVAKNPTNMYDLDCYHGSNTSPLNNLKHLSAWLYNLLHRSKWDQQSIFTLKASITKKWWRMVSASQNQNSFLTYRKIFYIKARYSVKHTDCFYPIGWSVHHVYYRLGRGCVNNLLSIHFANV